MHTLAGLTHGPYELATSHTALMMNDDASSAIIACIEEKAEATRKRHAAEWIAAGGKD